MSPRARLARVLVVLALDVVMAGAGVAMIVSYLRDREAAAAPAPGAGTGGEEGGAAVGKQVTAEVAVAKPEVVGKGASRSRKQEGRPEVGNRQQATGNRQPAMPEPEPDVEPGVQPEPDAEPGPEPGPEPEPGPGPDAALEPVASVVDAGGGGRSASEREAAAAEAVYETVRGNMGAIRRCYERAAKQASTEDPPSGKVVVRFTVKPQGDATSVAVVENTTGLVELGPCVAALIESWRFPSPGDEAMEFIWPFEFHGK